MGNRDAYARLLAGVLFPAFEHLRGRPTVALMRFLEESQWWPLAQLEAYQLGMLRRLVRHAFAHTPHYRELAASHGLVAARVDSLAWLARLPVLERQLARTSFAARTSEVPPGIAVQKASSGTTGEPMKVAYNAESRHFRDAMRWRAYGWAGYRVGDKAMHYWGMLGSQVGKTQRLKMAIDHRFKRDLYVDSTPRSDAALAEVVATITRERPSVIVAYTQATVALAKFVTTNGARAWDDIPIICAAERLWPHDRATIAAAFGPGVFETYGCREVMLIGGECDRHDGMHLAMENMITEILVREGDTWRAAAPGESGEVVVTDLHNLANPMLRYATGDMAVASPYGDATCACGRQLRRLGSVEGRVTETMYDGHGNPVSGLLFSILFVKLQPFAKQFQVVQRRDRSVCLRVVPMTSPPAPELAAIAQAFCAQYLPATTLEVTYVDDIELTKAGKLRLVVVER